MTTCFLRRPRRNRLKGIDMDFEKYTDRARGFVQSAQSLALREGHQQFAPSTCSKFCWMILKGSQRD